MCGQFAVLGSVKAIKDYYTFLKDSGFIIDNDFYESDFVDLIKLPNDKVKPMDYMPIVCVDHLSSPPNNVPELPQKINIIPARWGLVPFWAKDETIAYKTINARIETMKEKPSFKYAYQQRRCLIPVSGFYERDSEKILHYFEVVDDNNEPQRSQIVTFKSFAGLYEIWGPNKLVTFTIVTQEADDRVKKVHPRMPIVLDNPQANKWLLAGNI